MLGHTLGVPADPPAERAAPVGELAEVVRSGAPGRVAVVLDRIGPAEVAALDDAAVAAVVAVAGASDSLGDLLAEDDEALAALVAAVARPTPAPQPGGPGDPASTATPEALARAHRIGLLGIAARDLLGVDDLAATVAALSDLARRTLRGALAQVGDPDLAVVGMGKLGAGELNVVSDVDVLLVVGGDAHAAERPARRFLEVAGRAVVVDTALRPGGRDGALVRSVEAYEAHWARWASAWEFQALLKAGPVAGPPAVLDAFAGAASDALWRRPFDESSLREVRRLKARAEAQAEARGEADADVKRGRGGIRDIEFSVQLLQLVHGGADPTLRVPATLPALEQLARGGYVDPDEADTLARAYRFLRRLEHRLQLVAERQTHLVPTDRERRRRIARALGYRGGPEGGPTARLDRDLAAHRLAVRRVHEGWWFRPLLDAFADAPDEAVGRGGPAEVRLAAFGFRDARRTRDAVQELATGLTRSSRLMRQLLPLLLEWLAEGADPDLGLLGLRRLVSGEQRTMELVGAFRDSARTARHLCRLLAVGPLPVEVLLANPDLVDALDDPTALAPGDRAEQEEAAWAAVGWRAPGDERRDALRRWHARARFGIVARDVLGHVGIDEVGRELATLAEVVVATALRIVDPQVPLAVIGFGRLGGAELSYASDVDLVVVHDGAGPAAHEEATRAAAALLRVLGGTTPAGRILVVDPDLRPEGRQGPLARSLDGYTVYLERWAEVWERQALLRARFVAGDPAVGRGFHALVDHALWTRPPLDEDRRTIRRLKARVEAERIPRGVEPWRHLKLGPGGLADVEWTVQLLQWTRGIRRQATRGALGRLEAIGALSVDDAAVLEEAHRLGDRLRNLAWLVTGDGDVLPERPEARIALARAAGAAGPDALVEAHRRATRRARRVVERVFYGQG